MSDFSLRRQTRLRKEYLYRKSIEDRQASIQQRKDKIKEIVEEGKEIPSHLRDKAPRLIEAGEWDDEGPRLAAELGGEVADIDDEYRWAGVKDPKIVITTTRKPSIKLIQFVKEMKLVFPNCQRINRGVTNIDQIMQACRANDVTDFLIFHGHRDKPSMLTICHLPFGPTATFTLEDVVMRHDIPEIERMSEQYPHLIFNNFKSKIAERTMNILKYLFPVPKDDSKRVASFTNLDDWLLFRHHVYKKTNGGKDYELSEIGPRFSMKLYKIFRGTLDQERAADIEFVLKPFKNTARKKTCFSTEDPW